MTQFEQRQKQFFNKKVCTTNKQKHIKKYAFKKKRKEKSVFLLLIFIFTLTRDQKKNPALVFIEQSSLKDQTIYQY